MKNQPRTKKNQPGTMKNHENLLGTMKNQPGTLKKTYLNQPKLIETDMEPWKTSPELLKKHEN